MKATFDKSVFDNKTFNNKSVGPFGYFVHKISSSGSYHILITESNKRTSEAYLEFSDKSEVLNPHIDLKALENGNQKHLIKLHDSVEHVLFFNSQRIQSCRIQMRAAKTKKVEFDSHNPTQNDMYVIGLLKPGSYNMKNSSLRKTSKIDFHYNDLKASTGSKDSEAKNKFQISSKAYDISRAKSNKTLKLEASKGLIIEFTDKNRGFELARKKDFTLPEKKTFLYDLKKEIAARRKNRKKPNRKLIKRFRKEVGLGGSLR